MPTVTVQFGQTSSDPSGGDGAINTVKLSEELISIEGEQTITFQMGADALPDARFTAFRYYNTDENHWDKGWYSPEGIEDGPAPAGKEFTNQEISEDGKTMTVLDKGSNTTLYLYVLEWTEGGNTWVSDPKIKNQPPPSP